MKAKVHFNRYIMFPGPANLDIKTVQDIDVLYAKGTIPLIMHTDTPVEREGWYLFGVVGRSVVRINKVSDVSS